MTQYRRVRIPRPDGCVPSRRGAYVAFLRDVVYPAVDALFEAGLIEGYDFLTHPDFDLRFWIRDGVSDDAIQSHLLRFSALAVGLDPSDAAPAETGPERERLLRRLNGLAEITRDLLAEADRDRAIIYTEHYLLNQLGMTNLEEARWHLSQAQTWLDSVIARR